eukprot:Anaeramoba_flamelloidesa825471_22.p1 GENE.a825471_22~~a825471_22.p1  ORF type:complete len:290 (-),score=75.59 a825471_22:3-836(-)
MTFNVTVLVGSKRREQIKVKHTTRISSIIEEVKTRNKLKGNYVLKYQKREIESTLQYRLTGLPKGAKFILSSKKQKVGNVLIALDTANERFKAKFLTNSTLWSIIKKFDQQISPEFQTSGLLRQSKSLEEIKQKNEKKKQVMGSQEMLLNNEKKIDSTKLAIGNENLENLWMQPVIVFSNREFVGVQALEEATLERIGITSGNALLRFSLRASEKKLGYAIESYSLNEPYAKGLLKKLKEIKSQEEIGIENKMDIEIEKEDEEDESTKGKKKKKTKC